jgi:hypothetical protein
MPLPLFKLGALLAKQISKPLAKILKDKAKLNQRFRTYVVIPTANGSHLFKIKNISRSLNKQFLYRF